MSIPQLRRRVRRLSLKPEQEHSRPTTLFLVEVEPGEPTGLFDLGPGIGAELQFAKGTRPPLPSYVVKLVRGSAWDVLHSVDQSSL